MYFAPFCTFDIRGFFYLTETPVYKSTSPEWNGREMVITGSGYAAGLFTHSNGWESPTSKQTNTAAMHSPAGSANSILGLEYITKIFDTLLEKQSKFPRYNMKRRGKRDATWNIPQSIRFSPLHFMLYRGKSFTFKWDSVE